MPEEALCTFQDTRKEANPQFTMVDLARTLLAIEKVPSDNHVRYNLDDVDPSLVELPRLRGSQHSRGNFAKRIFIR